MDEALERARDAGHVGLVGFFKLVLVVPEPYAPVVLPTNREEQGIAKGSQPIGKKPVGILPE